METGKYYTKIKNCNICDSLMVVPYKLAPFILTLFYQDDLILQRNLLARIILKDQCIHDSAILLTLADNFF